MTEQQLWEAIRELQGIIVVHRNDLEALRNRVEELEQQVDWRVRS
jgi:polyhydroxyalkanoate synthesis regulator phasin